MNWKDYWEHFAANTEDEIAQVQRKKSNEISDTVLHIIKTLSILPDDMVLDVCCGNGLITKAVASHCHHITGIDHSPSFIAIANDKVSDNNIDFKVGDPLLYDEACRGAFDKIYLQFSLQYFDKKNQGEVLISNLLKYLKPNGIIFLGDVTDHNKLDVLYNTFSKKFFRLTSNLRGTNKMGKFWKKQELDAICKALKVKGAFIEQPNHLPYAHYRFDYLIKKNN